MNVYTILFTLHTQKIEEHWVLHHFTIYSLKRLTVYKPGPKIPQSSKLHSIFKIIQSWIKIVVYKTLYVQYSWKNVTGTQFSLTTET